MEIETDDALIGIGKLHRVMVWDGQREREKEMLWGLPSRDPDVFQIPLLKSETAIVDRPCLLLANEFGLVKRGKTIYAASLITDEPFFCIAAVWRPAHRLARCRHDDAPRSKPRSTIICAARMAEASR